MKFLIIARPFNHASMGVVALYKLAETLKKIGEEAEVLMFEGDGRTVNWVSESSSLESIKMYAEECIRNGVVVYPEIIFGNPLGARRVVRYMLNKEGHLKGWGMDSAPDDFILTHSASFCDRYHCEVLLPPQISSASELKRDSLEANKGGLVLTYVGKGVKFGKTFIPSGSVEVTRQWPSSREQFLTLLSNARYLVSYDPVSSVNVEAAILGAIPLVFVSDGEFIPSAPEFPYFVLSRYLGNKLTLGDLPNLCAEVDFVTYREMLLGKLALFAEDYRQKVSSFVELTRSHWMGLK